VFGGGELTYAAAPQLALGVDVGYRSKRAAPDPLAAGGFRVSLSAHWYVK
jgi:hypothetical protein